jgi:hypothetical protein
MGDRRFGEPVQVNFEKETPAVNHQKPDLKWEIGEETRRRLDELEENSRLAEHRLGMFLRA